MKGIIIINPFHLPVQSVLQAERLKEEFSYLNVDCKIVDNGFLHTHINSNGQICCDIKCDFAVYLDKDKYFSEILEKQGIKLFNSHKTIRLCDDKGQTYIALSNNDLSVPKTIFAPVCYKKEVSYSKEFLINIEEQLGYPIIIKESYGSMGKGVYKADNFKQLTEIAEQTKMVAHLFQEYIAYKEGTDIRIIVIGGKAVAVMERCNKNDFRSNIAVGGTGKKIDVPKAFIDSAIKASKIVGADYCGVDILYGKDNKPVICEVNSNAFFEGIEKITNVNVAKTYAQYIIEQTSKRKQLKF